ncbi:MAG: ABC transporter substrate-binding protein [Verrucomicrobia bacterium]|nr:ABC transporter substrate-binding protein [Verrucomicrobiota bacterium]
MTRQHRKPVGPVGLILAVALAGPIMLAPGCRKPSASIPPVHARLGLALQPTSALAMIAADNGYFREQNLDLEIKPYISGRRAMAALLCGDVDAVTTAEVPIVFSSFESSEFRIVASIASAAGQHSIVARRDAGIAQAGDLKGKRIGTQRASAVHFFLHLFLLQHQIDADEVTIEFMKGELLPEALATGRIDAFSTRLRSCEMC